MLNLKPVFKVKKKMKIGQVSKIVGISSSAIRFYERQGLLESQSISRAENGYRVYAQQDIDELRAIVKFKEIGLELKEIKALLGEESNSCGDLVSTLDKQLDKYREMESLIRDRIRLLLAAKRNCKANCTPSRKLRKCSA